jgi:putative lipase involved disintegration of autophagic bodies
VGLYKYLAGLNTYMLSMRGSAGGLTTKDWMDDDVSIGLGRLPDRTTDALKYTRKIQQAYPGAVIIIVGHSLGGHLAQYCGVMCNLPFITFNAPPALGVFTGKLPDGTRVDGFKLGLNFRVNYDPVSKISGDHVGPLVTLPLNGQKHGAAHTSQVVINSVIASGLGNHGAMAEITTRNR